MTRDEFLAAVRRYAKGFCVAGHEYCEQSIEAEAVLLRAFDDLTAARVSTGYCVSCGMDKPCDQMVFMQLPTMICNECKKAQEEDGE